MYDPTLDRKDSTYSHLSTCEVHRAKEPMLERYVIMKQLYKADIGNTTVSIARKKANTSETPERYILKEIDLSMLTSEDYVNQSRAEFLIQREMNHENIVQCLEFEEESKTIRSILELVNEPEYLQVELDDNMEPILDEFMLKTFMTELLDAVIHMHKKHIVHCDIKIENILGHVTGDQSFPSLKLCDFGLARRVDPITQLVYIQKKMGTREYMAPELKDKSYISTKVDIWSLGLVFYKMCTSYLPNQLCKDWVIKGIPLPIRDADWVGRSEELRDLIEKMLEIDPTKRISAQEAIEHPYLSI